MIAKKMVKFVEGSSVTRAMFEEGKKMGQRRSMISVLETQALSHQNRLKKPLLRH